MATTIPSKLKFASFTLATFLIAFPAMVVAYKFASAS